MVVMLNPYAEPGSPADLAWQILHLRSLRAEARDGEVRRAFVHRKDGLRDSIHQRSPRTESSAWGGVIGLTWMVVYWASLIPLWVYQVARVVSEQNAE
jgi:hypothetical protein